MRNMKYIILSCSLFIVTGINSQDAVSVPEKEAEKSSPPVSQNQVNTPERKYHYEGVHLGILLGFGTSYPHATFGSLPQGTAPDFGSASDFYGQLAWYFNNDGAFILRGGDVAKEIKFKDASGTITYKTRFLEGEVGYRFQADLFFAEGGLAYGSKTGDWSVSVVTSTTNVTGKPSAITKLNDLVGLFLSAGISYPLNDSLYLNAMAKYQQALSAVVDFPALPGSEGFKLTPATLSIQLGISVKF